MARPRLVTDEAILEATRAAAVERGPGVSLDVIAERLGVSAQALLKRFGSRQEILLAALRPSREPDWFANLERGPDDAPLAEQLSSLMGEILEFFSSEMPRMCALRESGLPIEQLLASDGPPMPVRGVRSLVSWLERARARGLVEGEHFESAALSIIGTMQTRSFLAHLFNKSWWRRSSRQFVADLAALFARSLAPTTPTAKPSKPRPGTPKSARLAPSTGADSTIAARTKPHATVGARSAPLPTRPSRRGPR